MNEKYVAPATSPTFHAPNPAAVPQLAPDMPRSVVQAEDQVTIRSNVAKMYGEKLTPSASVAPVASTTRNVLEPAAKATAVSEVPLPPAAALASQASPHPAVNSDTPAKSSSVLAASTATTAGLATGVASGAAIGAGTGVASGVATAATSSLPSAPSTVLEAKAPSGVSSPAQASSSIANDTTLSTTASPMALPAPVPAPVPIRQDSAIAVNSEGANNPTAPKLIPPVTSSAISMEAIKTDNWNTTDSAVTAPSAALQIQADQKNAAAGPSLAREAAAAGTVRGGLSPAAAGNASDIPDAAFIKNLAGTNGLLALDASTIDNPLHSDRTVAVQQPVHIDEAVAFALKNNFEVQASDERVKSAHWDKVGAYAQYGPSAEYDIDGGSEKSSPAAINDANGNRVLQNTHHRRDTNISVRQPLVDLGIIADILSAGDKEDAVKSDRRDVREGVASDTINTFLKLLQARIAVRLADEYKTYLDNLASRMTARVEGGGATSADLDRIHGRSELAYSARIEALGEYETDLSEFKRLTKVLPSQIKIPDLLAPAIPENMEQALDRAVQANPAYRSSLSKIDAAADDRNKAYAGLLPKLSVQYNKSMNFDAGGSAEGNPIDGVYPNQKEETVLVVAQWVLGATSVTTGLSGAAKEREQRLHSQDILDRMEQAMQSSYTAINAARQRRAVLQKTVLANERVVKGFEDQYKDGNRSLFDLLDSYEQLYSSRLNLMRVVIANAEAAYQVRREMGELVPSVLGAELN